LTNYSHTKAECTNEAVAREFTGTCRVCEQQGHRAADCPNRPPEKCTNCFEEGHGAVECKNPRKIDRSKLPELEPNTAWDKIKDAAADRDLEDVKDAAQVFFKAVPDTTYPQLEKAFRSHKLGIYLIAIEKELQPTFTNSKYHSTIASLSCSLSNAQSELRSPLPCVGKFPFKLSIIEHNMLTWTLSSGPPR
jgi:hypothetical protein